LIGCPHLFSCCASFEPQVCMVLRFVAEEVLLYADDLTQGSKRALLAGQQAALPSLLPQLTGLLEAHYGAALAAAQAQQQGQAQAHAAAVTAGLGAAPGRPTDCALQQGWLLSAPTQFDAAAACSSTHSSLSLAFANWVQPGPSPIPHRHKSETYRPH